MTLSAKRNLLSNFVRCWSVWRQLRRYPGLFSLRDALQNWEEVLLPRRFTHRAAGRALAKEARVEVLPKGVNRVTVLGQDLVFYWLGPVNNNLHYVIDQEFNPRFPHNYTTPPVRLGSQSLVLDVGACEALFAFRVLKQNYAARVICFEPSLKNVTYARQAGSENGLAERLLIEPLAVGKASGRVRFREEEGAPDAHFVDSENPNGQGTMVECVTLDEYCASNGIALTHRDLIKIDAEGSDLDVLLGAEKLIRNGAPQIAVTTYHKEEHAVQIVDFLKSIEPAYQMRLKGFSSWTPRPNPVLLQASVMLPGDVYNGPPFHEPS